MDAHVVPGWWRPGGPSATTPTVRAVMTLVSPRRSACHAVVNCAARLAAVPGAAWFVNDASAARAALRPRQSVR